MVRIRCRSTSLPVAKGALPSEYSTATWNLAATETYVIFRAVRPGRNRSFAHQPRHLGFERESVVGGLHQPRRDDVNSDLKPTMTTPGFQAHLGWWQPDHPASLTYDEPPMWQTALRDLRQPLWILATDSASGHALASGGTVSSSPPEGRPGAASSRRVVGLVPACVPEQLGDPGFMTTHRLRYPLLMGSMANGISAVEAVVALGQAGMVGFYGAAGQPLEVIESAIDDLQTRLGDRPFGCNLIHSPNEPDLEAAVADLYLRRSLHLVEASAYLNLTLPVVRYRVHGIHRDAAGRIIIPNRLIAKVSRVEVATRFLSPPPEKMLAELVGMKVISAEQAALAAQVPMVDDLTAEADSGGHTDNRPAVTLVPTMIALRDRLQAQFRFAAPPRIGVGGGIATPASTAAGFAMGAAYVVIGSVAQACRESGTSPAVRQMLAEAQQADIAMAPAADMFEMGVNVQVLKRGTMFAMRAAKLYEVYRTHEGIEAIPAPLRLQLEKTIFMASLDDVWRQTSDFFTRRDPPQIEHANRDPKHRLALVCRWYLGQASRWAIRGDPARRMDYQVWCGPAMGAFNEWVKGTFLEAADRRHLVTIALNLLVGACIQTRINALRQQGCQIPASLAQILPQELPALEKALGSNDG
jgi:trans-AT polyketide synthase, acyltransferase and oxidoreductase domains